MNLDRFIETFPGQRIAQLSRWWPTPIAAFGLVVALMVGAIGYGVSAVGTVTVFVGFALARAYPRLSAGLLAVGILLAFVTYEGNYTLVATLFAFAGALIAVFSIPQMRWRLIAGIPSLVLGPMLAFLMLVRQTMTNVFYNTANNPYYYFDYWQPVGAVFVALLAWALPFGARAAYDAIRVTREKTTVEARATVVESELRDERLRADITHDFHDVMAHSLAVLAAQAEGLRLTHKDHPERIEPVLTTISDTARLALVEVRQLLERVDDDARRPQPTVHDIPALIGQTRSAGPTVAFHDTGKKGNLSKLANIAAYRIVQEALTNALRHGGSDADIVVTLSWTGPGLSLAVSSPIRDHDALGPIGRGISGMHERSKQAGGWVDVDAEGERFVVTAYLPYEPLLPGATILSEDQLPTVPVAVQSSALHPRATATNWGEANARKVSLGEPDWQPPTPTAAQEGRE